MDTGDGTRSPVLDRRKAGFDSAGGGDSSSLDVLGNLLGKLPQTPSCSTSRPLLLLVLRLGERLGMWQRRLGDATHNAWKQFFPDKVRREDGNRMYGNVHKGWKERREQRNNGTV